MGTAVATKGAGTRGSSALAVLVVVAAGGAIVSLMQSNDDGSARHRESVVAEPTAPQNQPPVSSDDRRRQYRIMLQTSVVVREDATLPRGTKTVGYHGLLLGPDHLVVGNVPMERKTIPPEIEQRWRSQEFVAHKGDVVKTAIDVGEDLVVTCSIRQDGKPVLQSQVNVGDAEPGALLGAVSCVWVVGSEG